MAHEHGADMYRPGVLEVGEAEYYRANELVDTSKTWESGMWKNYLVRIRGGQNEGSVRVVRDNSTDTLYWTVPMARPTTFQGGVNYEILSALAGVDEGTDWVRLLWEEQQETNRILRQIRFGIGIMIGSPDLESVEAPETQKV